MIQDFDEQIDREGTNSYKYDLRNKLFGTDDVYPMWVADTEFKAPDFVLNALQSRLNHGVFGYTLTDNDYYNSIIKWNKERYGLDIKKHWIKYSPGVVPSLFTAVLAFTKPGDKVAIQTPVYYPFYSAIRETGREILRNPLNLVDGRYQMDFDELKNKLDDTTSMFILCNPHNPGGNVWKKDELEELNQICLERNIVMISDEIHADIIYEGHKHIPTALLSDEIAMNTLTLMAPSKTFNIAGLCSSYVFTKNQEMLEKFSKYIEGLHIGPNIFAIEATKAAYFHGGQWVDELISYYAENIRLVREFITKNLPQLTLIEPEGTFLLWIDCRGSGFSRKELNKRLVQNSKLGLSDGYMFGSEGEGFVRMNIGCSKTMLQKALVDFKKAFD